MSNYTLDTDSSEYHVLENAVKAIKNIPGILCEIGTRRGGSLRIIVDSLLRNEDLDRNVVSIDPYGNIEYQVTEHMKCRIDYTNQMKNETTSALYDYICQKPVNLVMLPLEDTEFFNRFSDGVPFYNSVKTVVNEYALVFFDGPHRSEDIIKELKFFQSRTSKGAFYIFDDIDNGYYPHDKTVEPWLFTNGWELIEKNTYKASYRRL